jgi:hypothetical protein
MKTKPKRDMQQTHSVSIAFPVNVAGATLAKEADLWLCGSGNIGITSRKVFWKSLN